MTTFDPTRAAQLLEPRLKAIGARIVEMRFHQWDMELDGVPAWHRTYHELESQIDAEYDRYFSLQRHIRWLYAEGARRFAPSAATD